MGTRVTPFFLFFILNLGVFFCQSGQLKTEEPTDPIEGTLQAIDGEDVIPQKYKSIYIHLFRNRSFKADFVHRLKEKIEEEFRKDGRLVVSDTKEKADLWMYGAIESYIVVPTDYDEFGKAIRKRLAVVASFRLWDPNNPQEPIVLDTRTIRFDTGFQELVPPFESEFSAEERLLRGLSRRIVYTAFEGWYTELKNEVELGYEKEEKKEITDPRNIGRGLPRKEREKLLQEKYKIKGKNKNHIDPDQPFFNE